MRFPLLIFVTALFRFSLRCVLCKFAAMLLDFLFGGEEFLDLDRNAVNVQVRVGEPPPCLSTADLDPDQEIERSFGIVLINMSPGCVICHDNLWHANALVANQRGATPRVVVP